MLPVSAWPPGAPGSSLSPFGKPRDICVPACGYVLPKGAWIVQTGGNQVVMYRPSWRKELYHQPKQQMGSGYLPGAPTDPRRRPTHDQALEAWRAWQRKTGNTDGPIFPRPGRVPPNFGGWRFVGAPATTLIPFGGSGLVLADGQNVVITGGGWANITQAYSV